MATQPEPPAATGVRLDWSALPLQVRTAVEQFLGSRVVSAVTQPGGFSPGVAARLRAENGQRVFVKAVGPEPNPFSPHLHRREATIVAALPAHAPVPRLLWTYDEGEPGWVALVFEDVDGRQPAQPWRMDELDRVLDAVLALSEDLTPSPLDAGSAGAMFAEEFCGWRRLLNERPAGLDDWSARHLEALAILEADLPAAAAGDTLLHLDLRADNLLLTPERVVVVDWPWARVGAAWVDLVCFAPSVAMQGGPDPETLLQRHPAVGTASAAHITTVVAAVAGFFTRQALLPPPPGLPTLRTFQAAQGVIARRWLAPRTGLR